MVSKRSPKKAARLAAVVLAAGDGTRMLSRVPKVIHSLYGKPLIGHVLDAVREAGAQKIVAVLGYRSDLVRAHLGSGVQTVVQRPLKGTGHALLQALPKLKGLKGDLVVLYGDTPLLTSQTVRGLIRMHRKEKAVCTLLTASLAEPTGYGRIVRDQTGQVVRIVEDADASQAERAIEEINVGSYCFDIQQLRKGLKTVKPAKNGEYYLTDVIDFFVKSGSKLATAPTRSVGEFLGINTRADLARVQTIMRSRILERFMLAGVTVVDPYTTYIDSGAVIGQDTIIYPHTVIEQGAKIGRRCGLGPFCRIGENTSLADDVKVGSFVEIADSQIGKETQIQPHSLITSASVGNKVQIGMGTRTVLSNGVRPAARSQKVRIGDRALIGGGSLFLGAAQIRSGQVVEAGSRLGGNH